MVYPVCSVPQFVVAVSPRMFLALGELLLAAPERVLAALERILAASG
jgi:hypothetical protein